MLTAWLTMKDAFNLFLVMFHSLRHNNKFTKTTGITTVLDTTETTLQTQIETAEKQFNLFFYVTLILFFLIIGSFPLALTEEFWYENKIWSTGLLLVTCSVIHAQHFNSSKDLSSKNLSPSHRVKEAIIANSWVVGLLLIAISRWFNV